MPKSYSYVRPHGRLPSKRKRNSFITLVVFAGIATLIFLFYRQFVLLPKKMELEKNRKIAELFLEAEKNAQSAFEFSYKGPVADALRIRTARSAAKTSKKTFEILNENLSNAQLHALMEIATLNAMTRTFLSIPFNELASVRILPEIASQIELAKKAVLNLELDNKTKDRILKTALKFEPKKVYKPAPPPTLSNKRRGLGIVSYSTKPKFLGKDEKGIFYLENTELLDVNIEVQNQGEIVEKEVKVTLQLESTALAEPILYEQLLEKIKPKERKPVSFSSIPLNQPKGTVYILKVNVNPVPYEKVKENNSLTLKFYVSP